MYVTNSTVNVLYFSSVATSNSSRAQFGAINMRPTALLLLARSVVSATVTATIQTTKIVSTIPAAFASFGWEMDGMIGLLSTMADPRFAATAKHLAPAIIRVGGITGDWVRYVNLTGEATDTSYASTRNAELSGYWPTSEGNLSLAMFKTLYDFVAAADLKMLFMLNELHGRNCQLPTPGCPACDHAWCEGAWDTSNVRDFLQTLHDAGMVGGEGPLYAFELGNELISHLDPITNVEDIVEAAGIIQSIWSDVPVSKRPGLYAPSTDVCSSPAQLEIMRNITNVSGVSGFTFHGYPGQSGTGSNNLTSLLLNSTWLRQGIMTGSDAVGCISAWDAGPRAAGLELLLTESSSSWAVNLPPPAQNSFLHTFFTVAELGQYSMTGVGLVARWAFSEGSPFATIRKNDAADRFDVAADYWIILAQKATSGSGVLAASVPDDSGVLVYAVCGVAGAGAVTVSAVNPGASPVTLSLVTGDGSRIAQAPRTEWVFTAPSGNLSSLAPSLNGGPPLVMNDDASLPSAFAPATVMAGGADIVLPPFSASYFTLTNANAAACL